jgi:hypothetical protein
MYMRDIITSQKLNEGYQLIKSIYKNNNVDQIYGKLILEYILKDSYKIKPQSYNKYDVIPLPIDYSGLDNTQDHGSTNMLGTEYIEQRKQFSHRGHYTYLRALMQKLQDMGYASKFDVDSTYKYDGQALARAIYKDFASEQINRVHDLCRQELQSKGRGRPKGARNKNKVLEDNSNFYSYASSFMPDVDFSGVDTIDGTAEVIQNDATPQSTQQLDVAKFVTHIQLHSKLVPICEDIRKIEVWGRDTDKQLIELETKVNNIELLRPTVIQLQKSSDLPLIDLGIQHHKFPSLLNVVRSTLRNGNRVIPWVYGPAGTGKSVAAEMCAKALDLPFESMGKTLAKFEITGFINTSGYQTTPFRKAYEFGGVFCADEMDAWSNEATTALNNGLANGHFPFPDATVKRHPNFVMICCANTVGAGATMEFVGRSKQDGATLDRFVYINWPLDEALEDSMCANKGWLQYVRHVRNRVTQSGINPKPMITPRATIFGESLLNTGIDWADVVDMCLRKGLTEAQWGLIK